MRAWAAWSLSAVLLGGAWLLSGNVPDDLHRSDAFVAPVDAEGWAQTRDLAVRVDGVTETAHVSGDGFEGDGRWIVVNVSARAVHDDRDSRSTIMSATLTADGRVYRSSDKMADDARSTHLLVDVPVTLSLAFPIAADADVSSSRLEIWDGFGYPEYDTLLSFDLDAPETAPSVTLLKGEPEW